MKMKRILPVIIICAALSGLFAFSNHKYQQADLNECVKKYRAEWGRTCSACKQDGNTYTVFLRNECDQVVDVKCAVQEKEKRWRTFTRLSLAPKDSMSAYACNGAGKYLYWVRKSGDKSIEFPTDEEINISYQK
jgi:hypothetical protein